MLPLGSPDRIHVAFDDHRLVANAGLLLPVTLAHHLGLGELVDRHVDLGDAPGRANPGDKLLTLVASALAGGDCIDDADVLRTGRTASAIGCVVKAPSTLGTFLRSFRWGHVSPSWSTGEPWSKRLGPVAAGAGHGRHALVDHRPGLHRTSETYGLGKEGMPDRHGIITGQRGLDRRRWTFCGSPCVTPVDVHDGRRAIGPDRRGARRTPLGARTTSCGRRWDGYATPEPPDNSPSAPTAASTPTPWSPSAARWTSATPSPSASTKACAISSRPYPRRTGRPSLTGWTAAPTWPRLNTHPSSMSPTPRQRGSSSAECSPRLVPNWRCLPTTAITPASPTGRGAPWNWRPTTAAMPRSRTPSAT